MDSRLRQLLTTLVNEYAVPLDEKNAELSNPAADQVGAASPEEAALENDARARARALGEPFEAGLKAAVRRGGAGLRLQSGDPIQSRIADALIQFLVRPKLASVRTEEPAPGQYVYDVSVDWPALRRVAAEAGINLEEALGVH